MVDAITLNLPWPPSVNHYKKIGGLRKTKNGKIYQSRINTTATYSFYYDVYSIAKKENAIEGLKFARDKTISVGASIYLYPPDKRRYDIDNRLKVLFDSLMHAKILMDDSQITRLYVQKMDIILVPGGRLVLELYALDDESEVKNAHFRS